MKTTDLSQLAVNDIYNIEFDLFIVASGAEKRAPFLASKILDAGVKINNKLCICFNDRAIIMDKNIQNSFSNYGFKLIYSSGSSFGEIESELLKITNKTKVYKSNINILIDYSCMTKVWYAGILNFINRKLNTDQKYNLYFSYTLSQYENPHNLPNCNLQIVPGFSSNDITPDKGVSLIIGLGYEEKRALGLIEYLDVKYSDIFLFCTDNANESKKFTDTIKKNNKELFDLVDENRIFYYNISTFRSLDIILTSLTDYLCLNSRVILAPLGPKPFALFCFLLCLRNKKLSMLRVSVGEEGKPYKRLPKKSEDFIICKVTFQNQSKFLALSSNVENVVLV